MPYFPSTCPFVTSVGATQYFAPEEAVSSGGPGGYYGGGGFSSYFSPPSYQASDVGPYVKSLGNKYQGLYNNTGRGYPDVAAQGCAEKCDGLPNLTDPMLSQSVLRPRTLSYFLKECLSDPCMSSLSRTTTPLRTVNLPVPALRSTTDGGAVFDVTQSEAPRPPPRPLPRSSRS